MKDLLKEFENKRPEIVFEWKDPETEAEGWVVINSLRGGAAGGGTRMRAGLDKHEVVSLAKTMEIKFTISGPPIGGAKSGINFDPRDPRKEGVLERWFAAVKPLLKYYYGTGGDLNVDEIHEVIPITEDVGVWHPQEGVFNGHFQPREAQMINRIGQLRQGVIKVIEDERYSPDVSRKYTIADMVTGFGVAEAVKHYYALWGGNLHVKRAVIQGWGNVAASAGFYLSKMGVNIVAIIDREGGVIKEEGFSYEEIRQLFLNRNGNQLASKDMIPYEEMNRRVWDLEFEVFVPAASSRLISRDQVDRMVNSKLEVFSCGANVPFDDPEIFFGPTGLYADDHFSVIPDFVANCGMARVFAYFMENEVSMEDEAIFTDVSERIRLALENTYKKSTSKFGIAQTSFEIALGQLI
ncbi:Glu/Leu/Phe/Val dehydrogenase dimerization domain-containing protein [Fulvivirga sedimenti]|uniref:Amino acid dehydrogenase n=1 Tax=Fulvivirga sedimenti TaxID=2879465 RepID=A0A9X1HTT0_9BACT|nr:Glu/Leu/Phe/Val dehydrogenase dimerization domain-containing protein [Fulvivirga sedimenti]MCA6078178.1 amino acid dehydrogenase [Fulvivirga sedimenti]